MIGTRYHRQVKDHALEWVVPSLARLIVDDVVASVGLVDVDFALRMWTISVNLHP